MTEIVNELMTEIVNELMTKIVNGLITEIKLVFWQEHEFVH